MGGKSWFWAQIGGLEAKLWFHAHGLFAFTNFPLHGCLAKCYHEENGHIAAQRVPYAVKEL